MGGIDILKKFAVNLGASVATEIVRGWLNEKLKNTSPSDLYEAITCDKDLWNATPDKIKKQSMGFAERYGTLFEKYDKHVTTELILKWIQEDQPALFSTIINTPPEGAGIMWLDRQVNKIKQQIKAM